MHLNRLLAASRSHHRAAPLPTEAIPHRGNDHGGRGVQPTSAYTYSLSAGEVATAGGEGHGRAACGRLIPAAGLTIESPPEGFCAGYLSMGTAR
jgi:hypothetical protein